MAYNKKTMTAYGYDAHKRRVNLGTELSEEWDRNDIIISALKTELKTSLVSILAAVKLLDLDGSVDLQSAISDIVNENMSAFDSAVDEAFIYVKGGS